MSNIGRRERGQPFQASDETIVYIPEKGFVKVSELKKWLSEEEGSRAKAIARAKPRAWARTGAKAKEEAGAFETMPGLPEGYRNVGLEGECRRWLLLLKERCGLSEKVMKRSEEILGKILEDKGAWLTMQGKKPRGIAAAIAYTASLLEGEGLKQKAIVAALDSKITEVTIRSDRRRIEELLKRRPLA